jgi:hypothetical protein
MLVSRSGPTMLARIGVMKALNRRVERVIPIAKIPTGANGSSREIGCDPVHILGSEKKIAWS